MTLVKEVKEKVFEYTKAIFSNAEIDPDGDTTFEYQSTKVWIDVVTMSRPDTAKIKEFVNTHQLPNTLIRVRALLAMDVPRSPALFQWVATLQMWWSGSDGRRYGLAMAETILGRCDKSRCFCVDVS